MSRLSLYLLGAPRIEVDGVPVEVSRRKAIALIAYLAVTGESHNRDSIASFLWPDYDQTRSRAALRWTLSALNKAVGKGWLEVDGERVGLKRSEALWADVEEFHKHLSECRRHGHKAEGVCSGCIKPLTEAVRLYRGDFMAGFSLQDSVSFDDWQFMETQRLRSEMALALERLVRCEGDQGELEAATGHARRWIEIDRASEKGHRQLMELYARTGQRAAALRQYEECEKILEKELRESPHEETVQLYEAIKENRVGVAEVSSVKPQSARSNNLPRQLTSFIGRENEIAEVKRLLSSTPLLTLTGAGGCGKTRLALKVASDLLAEYKDGVWLVELAALSDPALVPQEVAGALDVSEQPGRPLTETLSDFLRSKSLLLLLDNCEHLLEECAALAETLLRACPNLRILAASREGLGISGELTYRVPSLSMPDPQRLPPAGAGPSTSSEPALSRSSERSEEETKGQNLVSALTQYESVRLFIDRAAFSKPGFALTAQNALPVAQICCRLDGIPLAIELAAALVKGLSVEQIAARLDDRFRLLTGGSRTALPRQQTLRATIDWSYNLLSEAERVLFDRLSVFAGGWTIEAAEAICADLTLPPAPRTRRTGGRERAGVRVHPDDVLDLTMRLVDKSLVVVEEHGREDRYRLLETIKQYARDKLLESGEGEGLRGRHLEWFMELAEEIEPEFHGPDQVAWMDQLEIEHDNLRAALHWADEIGEAEIGLRLAGALGWFWEVRGYLSEGLGWLEGMLSKSGNVSASVRAKALHSAGHLALNQEDYDRAAMLEKSLALYRELGDKRGIAKSLVPLGYIMGSKGDLVQAAALVEESLALHREAGDKWGIADSLLAVGFVAQFQGDYGQAIGLFEESLALFREMGDKWGIAFSSEELGYIMISQGDYGRAEALFEESLALWRETGNKGGTANSLDYLGLVALSQGDYDRAVVLCKESLSLFREVGIKWTISGCLEVLAGVAGAGGQPERAARLFGAAEAIREAIGSSMQIPRRDSYDRNVAAIRAQLSEEAFRAAWAEGRKMTMEEAVQLAGGSEQ